LHADIVLFVNRLIDVEYSHDVDLDLLIAEIGLFNVINAKVLIKIKAKH